MFKYQRDLVYFIAPDALTSPSIRLGDYFMSKTCGSLHAKSRGFWKRQLNQGKLSLEEGFTINTTLDSTKFLEVASQQSLVWVAIMCGGRFDGWKASDQKGPAGSFIEVIEWTRLTQVPYEAAVRQIC